MLKAFLLVFDSIQIDRQSFLNFLDTKYDVKNWYAFLPNAIIIVSDQNTFYLSDLIRKNSTGIRFVITEIATGIDGLMNKEVWDFVNNLKSSGKWDSLLSSLPIIGPIGRTAAQ